MSESDGFTEEDTENYGRIKRDIQDSVLTHARKSPELYEAFKQVCDDIGRNPSEVLADEIVRAVKNEGHADALFETEVNLQKVRINDIREEDIDFVMRLREEYDLGGSKSDFEWLDDLVRDRIEAKAGGSVNPFRDRNGKNPMAGGESGTTDTGRFGELENELKRIESKLDKVVEDEPESTESTSVEPDNRQSIDDLFDDGGEEDKQDDEEEDGGLDLSGMGESQDSDDHPITPEDAG